MRFPGAFAEALKDMFVAPKGRKFPLSGRRNFRLSLFSLSLACCVAGCADGGPGTISGAVAGAGRVVDQLSFWDALLSWARPVGFACMAAFAVYRAVQEERAQKGKSENTEAGCISGLIAFAVVMGIAIWVRDYLAGR